MVSGRPLLYLSLPGVAFILGVFWFRRRNKNRLANGDDGAGGETAETSTNAAGAAIEASEPQLHKTTANGHQRSTKPTPSKSMNITGDAPLSDEDNPSNFAKLFGKSAPIQIVQNGVAARGSPLKASQKQQQQQQQPAQQLQIDSEVLKTKIQDAGQKVLRAIDEDDDFENMSSPVDLPDSVNTRVPFYGRTVSVLPKDEPVVIKATRTPKISPENSFLESKYTKECEQNNNCAPVASSASTTAESQPPQQPALESTQLQTQLEPTVVEGGSGGNEKRNVDTASPSLSLCSVQSGDSGKGSSLPRSEATRAGKIAYEFFFPNLLIGQLYGRKRSFINHIKAKSGATVILRKKVYAGKVRICAIEGSDTEIEAALTMIRQRMPVKRYPNFTMQRVHFAQPQSIVPLSTESRLNLQLNLIEGINNDVVVSAVISGSHIFVQHPLHPSHPSLAVLQKCLYDDYNSTETPMMPGCEMSAVCVLSVNGIWYRVQIVENDVDDAERCVVKFLDFGGYMNVPMVELRQIRSDFMSVPFQATECLLSNIEPIGAHWSHDAADILCKLTNGIVLQAQVAGYNSQYNIPEIYLFACLGPNNVIFINKELVARNLATWVDEIRD